MSESDLKPDRREPITYATGKVIWSRAFIDCGPMEGIKPFLKGGSTRDLGMYLYFVYSPHSNYYEWSEEERIIETLNERITKKEWMTQLTTQPEFIVLRDYYRRLVLTAGQKMYFGLLRTIDRFLHEVADVNAGDDPKKAMEMVKLGAELLKSEKDVQMLMSKEGERVVHKGYTPDEMELPPDQR